MTDYAISALSALTTPAPGDLLAMVDVSDTTTPPAGSAGSDKKVTLKDFGRAVNGYADLCSYYGAKNDGSASIATALASACSDAVAADPAPFGVSVPPGVFKVTAPQLLPRNLILQGPGAIGGDVSNMANGAVFAIDSAFSGGSSFLSATNNSDHSTANGPLISGIFISGKDQTATPVTALDLTGPVMTKMKGVVIAQMSGGGINTHPDLSAAEIGCYGQNWEDVFIDSCAGIGARLIYTEDSLFTQVYIIGCGLDNWQVCGADNTQFNQCRGEWSSSGYGMHVTNITEAGTEFDWTYATGMCCFNNFTTDANNQSGIRVDASWQTGQGAGTGPGVLHFVLPVNRRDGKANAGAVGSWAGIDVDYSGVPGGSAGLPVYVNGIGQQTGIGDGGAGAMSPRYGVRVNATGPAPVKFGGVGQVWGFDTAVSAAGTHTNYVMASTIDQVTGNNYSYTG